MRWATRRHCHVDRAACAWLIRRSLDPEAEFVFVDDPDEVPADATPFDMRGVELSHHGGDCSFETFLRRYELGDPVLWEIAKVVHEADLADERYDAPEASGLDVLLRGLSMVRDDEELLALSGPLFDGLYEYRKRALLAMWLGYLERGARGALLVALPFVVPPFVLVTAVAALYAHYQGLSQVESVFFGVGPAVMAIIAIAAYKLARSTNKHDL